MDINFPRRKRGRPPKTSKGSGLMDLDFPAPHLPESSTKQVQFGYRILQDILKFSKTRHLVEKPDENLFGLHDYYTVVQRPMWFNEILRKFTDQEYKLFNEILGDIRLVLENCYKFWGSKHRFSKQAFRIEKLLERELQNIPPNVREICSLDIVDEETNSNCETDTSFFIDDFNSKILKSIEKKEKEDAQARLEVDKEKKIELQKWETEVLEIKNHHKHIVYMAELAEIGHFLTLCHEVLCLKKVTQFEIERMLLMPRESSTLATIMTALLCPSALRGNLYLKPIMVYEVWSKFLTRKVEIWYNNFLKVVNKTQMFIRYGIETPFWEEVGETNPLSGTEFSDISFMKRVWILKTLCTTIFQSYKRIEEYFNSVEDTYLRGPVVYEDGKFEYISLFHPEVRVYRICRSEMDIDSKGEAIAIIPVKNGFPPDIQIQGENSSTSLKNLNKKNKFHLAAFDITSLSTLIKVCSQRKKSLSALRGLLTTCASSDSRTVDALVSMKNQWMKYKERSEVTVNTSLKYWIEKEMSPPATPEDSLQFVNLSFKSETDPLTDSRSSDLTGKRLLKKKFSLDDLEISSDSSLDLSKAEEETSDWEEGNIRRKVGRRRFRLPKWDEAPVIDEDLIQIRTPPFRGPPPSLLPVQASISSSLGEEEVRAGPSCGEWPPTPLEDPLALPTGAPLLPLPPPPLPHVPGLFEPSFYGLSPMTQPLQYRPAPARRPYYRRGRGRGPRMRYFTPVGGVGPVRKLVRRPQIVASEISSLEATEQNALTISFLRNEPPAVGLQSTPLTIPPLPKLEILDNDLLPTDLQSIKLDPWLQGLD